jgi:hypothetical protein
MQKSKYQFTHTPLAAKGVNIFWKGLFLNREEGLSPNLKLCFWLSQDPVKKYDTFSPKTPYFYKNCEKLADKNRFAGQRSKLLITWCIVLCSRMMKEKCAKLGFYSPSYDVKIL